MTNREIWDIAMKQSAIDANCDKNDFIRKSFLKTELSPKTLYLSHF